MLVNRLLRVGMSLLFLILSHLKTFVGPVPQRRMEKCLGEMELVALDWKNE